ncbi:hypothetical protein LDZ95_11080, partial [Pseudomonas aeruginosa]|nr:hypothetical protein [Pseudomonas aeruginosa]
MPRPAWTLYAYQLIEPDDQLDLFACREVRVHVVARQLELDTPADRTLCGKLLPAQPRWQPLERALPTLFRLQLFPAIGTQQPVAQTRPF